MLEPKAGDLFACCWEPDDEAGAESFRLVGVEAVGQDELTLWAYGDVFTSVPASADVTRLRRIRLHESLGGPAAVPKNEFRSWSPVAVARA